VSSMTFAGPALDRVPERRRDPAWVAELAARPDAQALLLSEAGVRAVRNGTGAGRLALSAPAGLSGEVVLLGLDEGVPLFAVDVGDGDGLPGETLDMRTLASELPERETGLAAYAAALLNWHRRHRFCSNCGNPTDSVDAGHERRCPACGAHHFPRTDPVVIMRVLRGDSLLLGHKPEWAEQRYSVLAGFVEPGETLEQTVRREVLEEAGVAIGEVEYVASQPWPFPSSLMLGFEAYAVEDGAPPHADGHELTDVRWFAREEVLAAARDEGGIVLPPPLSIARRLIDGWLGVPTGPGAPGTRRRSW
jgi:NAD+ diphosphatase